MAYSFERLELNEIHVWIVSLKRSCVEMDRLYALLSTEEQERSIRYLHRPTRDQFVITRSSLRLILSGYMGVEPSRIHFAHGRTGKPLLAGGGLHFNVSHSHELAVVAVTRRNELGIDLERVRSVPSHLEMAERYFSPGEAASLARLPPGARELAFYHTWTRKEAFLKALGLGLTHGLERFEVSVPPDDPARILHIDGDPDAAKHWSILELYPEEGYVGALAIEETNLRVKLLNFDV